MKRSKRILLFFLVVVILSQVPFAYRRYKLRQLRLAIAKLNSERSALAVDDKFAEYKGVSHVHSALGGHSEGTFEEIIRAAKANDLNFVLMTEHTSGVYNTAALTLQGVYENILFVNGNEWALPNSDRLLLLPGPTAPEAQPTVDEITRLQQAGSIAIVAYPEHFNGWANAHYDGIEVYNLYTNSRQINPIVMFFDALWSYRTYPDLLFANFYRRPTGALQIWDSNTKQQKLTGFAGTDAHSNVGLSLIDSSGHTILGIKLDPYERTFQFVRMHVLIPKDHSLDRDSLLAALRAGHCFIAFDIFGDSSGFRFTATSAGEEKIQGDEIALSGGVRLNVTTPFKSRMVLFKDGQIMQDERGVNVKDYSVSEKGVYRVEVYLPQLPGRVAEQPWIISNPIYVR